MAFNPKNYVGWWKQFSVYIRFERAKGFCEECGVGNHTINPITLSRVVLTVAHLDDENGICKCKEIHGIKCAIPSHVKALCQRCHLALDRSYHVKKRAENLAKKKDSERGLFEAV